MKWISVKERLPESYLHVLVYDTREEVQRACVDSGGDWVDVSPYGGGDFFYVTHWMPLPEAPTHCSATQESQSPQ